MNLSIFHLFHGVGARGKGAYTPLPKAWKGGGVCRTMILLLPLFWKTLRKRCMFSMEGKKYH